MILTKNSFSFYKRKRVDKMNTIFIFNNKKIVNKQKGYFIFRNFKKI